MMTMRLSTGILAVAALLFTGNPATVSAGDACKNVKFKIVNQRPKTIRITKVQYHNADNNKTQSENINPNLECKAGMPCTTNGDDLRDSEGVNLTNFVFFFNDAAVNEIGLPADTPPKRNWSALDLKTQAKVPADKKCRAGRLYSGDPAWTIK
jgi:hypothetical protein